jgi:hypothetical protein
MQTKFVRTLLLLGAVLLTTLAPWQAFAASCSNGSTAGSWAYTYTGTLFTAAGPLPAAAVGHFKQDSAGNISGGQSRSVAGQSGAEDISGTNSVSGDCTASATINVLVDGVLQRTAVIALVYDNGGNHMRGIFQSLTLPNGTNVPVVITIDGNRLTPRD